MGARRFGRLPPGRVDLITSDAVKNRAPALGLETRMVAAIVVNPQSEEKRGHQQAVDDGSGSQIEHGNALAKRISGSAQAMGPHSTPPNKIKTPPHEE